MHFGLQGDGLRHLEPVPPAPPTLTIQGGRNETVLVSDSRQYAANFSDGVQMAEVDAGHNLSGHVGMIWGHPQSFLSVT
jgi:hypothetical protein